MSWSKRFHRLSFLAVAIVGTPLLAACTLTPVYSGRLAETGAITFAYTKPSSRLEQVIYQELSLRFPSSDSETVPLATVRVGVAGGRLVDTITLDPNKDFEVTVTATLTIQSRDGGNAAPVVITRKATAGFTRGAQILSDQFAFAEASERAAKSAAESLRIAILATLTR